MDGNRASDQRLEIHVSLGGDFAGDDDQAGGGQGFAGHAAERVFGQAGIENRVRNLVGDLVGMAFGYGFRGKKIAVPDDKQLLLHAIWTVTTWREIRTQQPINEHFADFNKLSEKRLGSNDYGPGSSL